MISNDAQQLAALIRAQFGLHDLLPHLVRLLAHAGEPVTVEHAAQTGGFTVEQVHAELARHPGVDWDDDGQIVGFGATLRPTPHRFTTADGQTLYGFCASDALAYPAILDQPGTIESSCPSPTSPSGSRSPRTASSQLTRRPRSCRGSGPTPRSRTCAPRSAPWATSSPPPHAAADWQTDYPHATLVPIAEDFEVNREAMIALGWTGTRV